MGDFAVLAGAGAQAEAADDSGTGIPPLGDTGAGDTGLPVLAIRSDSEDEDDGDEDMPPLGHIAVSDTEDESEEGEREE